MEKEYVLVINPGSTSTKVAVFKNQENILQQNLSHTPEVLEKFYKVAEQYQYRRDIILDWFRTAGFETTKLKAVVARGGLLKPMPSGTYQVTDEMIKDLQIGVQGEHASNLGGIIAKSIADAVGIQAYIVDPVAVDEFDDIARISGIPEIKRRSLVHALNIKAVAYRAAGQLNRGIKDLNLVMAHLGGGISIVPLRKGKIVDANNANEMGPFSPERTGGLPVGDLAELCFSGKYTLTEVKKKLLGKGGLVAYLGSNDARVIEERIQQGDEQAKLVYEAMAYQVAKEIGAMATVLEGKVDAVVLTGGIAYSKMFTALVQERVSFIAPVILQPGEDEMIALHEGLERVLSGRERVKIYEEEVKSGMKTFDEILKMAKERGPKTIAVAVAQDIEVLSAVNQAKKLGIADAILVGDAEKIKDIAAEENMDITQYEIIDIKDIQEASRKAVSLVSSGKAHLVMKGLVDTSIVLKAVLDPEIGLRTGSILSHAALFEVPGYDRFIMITDAAMNIAPDIQGKKKIIENAVQVAHALDMDLPKVAVICAKEKVDPKMPPTVDAQTLEEMNKKGEIKGCMVGGPFGLDNAVSEEAAEHKGIQHPIAGKADILLVPDIEAGNILYKSMVFFGRTKNAGVIVGAKAPIVLTSRADSDESKLNSIALAVLMASKAGL